jgi:DnaJ-class molecular chaperone
MACFTCQGRGYILDWDGQWMCSVCKGHGTKTNGPETVSKRLHEVMQDVMDLIEILTEAGYDCETGNTDCCAPPHRS